MRFFILVIFTLLFLNAADTLEVKALNFEADENNGIIELNNNVEIKKGQDELYASKVVIHIDKNRIPLNYSAYGGVTFVVVTKDNRKLHGKANEVFYNATNGEYKLIGDGEVIEDNKINSVTGEEIIINNDIGYVNITGTSNKPAKLIFQLEDSERKIEDNNATNN
ncbi:hypothetical protein CCY99_02615 [Helicobacter sp. 16-1353]|uniref:LptA/OstA family protein n=1 Tax=Helicobacter sp. 16-1353 TaxID=2004996 RepID=UPI000DCAF7A4|nr:LptA/OstA family protein [Helicobacter sp. 16-1353]RAX54675.1 hypothetical protein CCY99_02615 [Helicobacter sp. 16-1353]